MIFAWGHPKKIKKPNESFGFLFFLGYLNQKPYKIICFFLFFGFSIVFSLGGPRAHHTPPQNLEKPKKQKKQMILYGFCLR